MRTFTKSVPVILICLFFFSKTFAQTYVINTMAGNGDPGYSGNGGTAVSAELDNPSEAILDPSGNVYIADSYNNVIRLVNTSGVISTFAGNGVGNYYGDGGPATAAELNTPYAVAIDVTGNVYIVDSYNNAIRMVNTSGIISTFAGYDGFFGYSGDGGPATAADLDFPTGVAADASGNIYIADNENNVIRLVNTSGIINTIAGNGIAGFTGDGGQATSAELNYPLGVMVNSTGNIYISDYDNERIRVINTGGIISTIVGNGVSGYSGDGGPASAAELFSPWGITMDGSGNLYIADADNNVIREVNTGNIISTIAGNYAYGSGFSGDGGAATSAELYNPTGVALDGSGVLYITDQANNRVRKTCTSTATPGPITGPVNLCSGASETYSIAVVVGATSYTWTLPTGWSGSSTSTSIIVTAGAGGGNITVSPVNACGAGPAQILAVNSVTPPNASICYVTVDTTSTYNVVFWSKTGLDTLSIDSFRIYRQVIGNYVQIGSVASTAFPSFIDLGSTPNNISSLYEIGVLDTCMTGGIDSSNYHQTILLQASIGVGNVVNLSWNASAGATVSYYRILRDTTGAGDWQKLDSVSSSIFAYTDLTPPLSPNLQYVINTVWNLDCTPTMSVYHPGVFYSLSSYSNKKMVGVVTEASGYFDISSAMDVFPNPATSEISLEIHLPLDGYVSILNVLGQEVYKDQFTSSNDKMIKQISLSGLNSGVYILKLESNGQTLIKKFVKI
jgi:hypothetical protein